MKTEKTEDTTVYRERQWGEKAEVEHTTSRKPVSPSKEIKAWIQRRDGTEEKEKIVLKMAFQRTRALRWRRETRNRRLQE